MLSLVKAPAEPAPRQSPADKSAALRAEFSELGPRLEQLRAERAGCETYEAARAIDAKISRAQWRIEHLRDVLIPKADQQLAADTVRRTRARLVEHRAKIGTLYRELRTAVLAATAVQARAIEARQAAVAEIGESLVQGQIPVIVYRGLLLPDLVSLWTGEADRTWALPWQPPTISPPRPRPISLPTAAPATPVTPARPMIDPPPLNVQRIPMGILPAPVPIKVMEPPRPRPPQRALREDPVPEAGSGQVRVQFLRPGVEVEPGFSSLIGDIINVPKKQAEQLGMKGAVEIIP